MCDPLKSKTVLEIARTMYDKSFEHGLQHVERVYKWALKIVVSEKLRVDPLLLELAVYLHDVGRAVGEPHAYYSATIARELLREAGCSNEEVEEVVESIMAHSFSYANKRRDNLSDLAKLLSDADKLDALGVVGFIRVFLYGERRGRELKETINHFYEKIFKLHELVFYETSKRLADKYTERARWLLDLLLEELDRRSL